MSRWVVWGSAISLYLLAVFHRSSLAVAGLAAAERFDITASQLATFTMLQLLVYSVLARQGKRSVFLVWAAFLTLVGLGLSADSLRGLLTVVLTVDALLLAALLAISLYVTRPSDDKFQGVVQASGA